MKPAINRRLFTRFSTSNDNDNNNNDNDNDDDERDRERAGSYTVSHRVSRVSRVNTLGIDMVPREKGHLHQEWR